MSKQPDQKKVNYIPLVALSIGGLLLLAAAVFFYQQSKSTVGGTPILTVDQQRIDYGDVKYKTDTTFTIKVTNSGDDTLRFEEAPYIEVLDGC